MRIRKVPPSEAATWTWTRAARRNTAQRAAVCEAILAGEPITAIGRRLGISRQRVSKIAQGEGLSPDARGLRYRARMAVCPVCGTLFRKRKKSQQCCSLACSGVARSKTWDGLRPCRTCGQWLPLSEYYVVNPHTGQLGANCKPCQRAYLRAWYAAKQATHS